MTPDYVKLKLRNGLSISPDEAIVYAGDQARAARLEALEEAAKIVEEFGVPMIKLAAKYGPSFPTSKPYADAIRERMKT